MNQNTSHIKVSIILHIISSLAVLPFILFVDKIESLLFINRHHHDFLDVIFYHVTRLPELAMIVFIIVLAIFQERRIFISVIIALLFCGISIFIFKQLIFSDYNRPLYWLSQNQISFHHVNQIQLHSNGSFPSGHTMAAFCCLGMAGFISRNGLIQFLLFLLAASAAYSRVYIAQHYLIDVYIGALMGYVFSLFIFLLFQTRFKSNYWLKPLLRWQL